MFIIGTSLVQAQDQDTNTKIEQAKGFFEHYVALAWEFDPAIAELYADDALIRGIRHYPNGEVEVLETPAPQYKAMLPKIMPLAEARGDRSQFSEVTYAVEGERVRIRATRYSELKQYSSPFELLVGPSENDTWLIYEEISESHPCCGSTVMRHFPAV